MFSVAADVRRRIPLMDALVHLLTSVATLRYSRTAFFTLT